MKRNLLFAAGLILCGLLVGVEWGVKAAPRGQEGRQPEEAAPPRLIDPAYTSHHLAPEGIGQPESLAPTTPGIYMPWSKIVFTSYRDWNYEIYRADGDGSNQTRLTWDAETDVVPRMNRGATKIVFTSYRTGSGQIFVMNPDSSGLTQLTSGSEVDDNVFPAWSPDGTRIAFQSYRDGQAEIYVMNADGSGQTRLTWDGDYDGQPAWSPDGSKIAFVSRRTGGYRVYVMNPDGGGLTRLSNQYYSFHPVWSPDGSQIAYDSDGDDDGWQELWLMNANGSNQREVYGATSYWDAWAGSWSPDGLYVAFTLISWIYYQGNWYWQYAYINAWNIASQSVSGVTGNSMDWYPDWQTEDAFAPTSSMTGLPAQSPAPFTVSWSGYDNGQTGLKNYDVQARDGAGGTWADWMMATTATSGSYAGVGGHTYYFRARGRDNVGNAEAWPEDYDVATSVEANPPHTRITQLPAYLRNGSLIQWGGSDPGGSGIASYDVQYRDTAGGDWVDWQTGTTEISAYFSGTPGHTYYFRSRATDNAQNVESWPSGNGDTSSTLYTWGIAGTVHDNAGVPVANASVTTTPGAYVGFSSDENGNYATYIFDSASTFTAVWDKDGYGDLPTTNYDHEQDAQVDVVLPPIDNIVQDWGFESGATSPYWFISGEITPVIASESLHNGQYAARLGQFLPTVFSSPMYIGTTDNQESRLKLAVGDDGIVHIVWQGLDKVYYSRREFNGIWSAPQDISGLYGGSDPQIALGEGNSDVHVVWKSSGSIYYAHRGSGGDWSSPNKISGSLINSYYPRLVVGSDDIVHVLWLDISGSSNLYYSRSLVNGEWSEPEYLTYGVSSSVTS